MLRRWWACPECGLEHWDAARQFCTGCRAEGRKVLTLRAHQVSLDKRRRRNPENYPKKPRERKYGH